jgi:hypothetical protein
MKRLSLQLATIGLTLWLLPGRPALGQQAGDPPPGRAALEGTVVNAQNGRIVPRATVIARALARLGEAKSVHADGEGHFLFKSLAPGSYRLSAERQSFFSSSRHQVFQYRVDVAADEHRSNIVLRLLPAAVVTGQVVDENSDPLQHVHVRLMERIFRNHRMQLDQVQDGLTDDQGRYRIFDVRPGTYYLVAEIEPDAEVRLQLTGRDALLAQGPAESDIAYSPMFYPDTADFTEAQALPVGPGGELQANFIFYSRPSVSISGKVVNGVSGEPARNAAIVARWSDYLEDNQSSAKNSPVDGGFQIRGLAPGTYTLRASFAEEGLAYSTQRTVEVGSAGVENVVLSALPDTPVSGAIKVDGSDTQRNVLRRVSITFQDNTSPAHALVTVSFPKLEFETRLHPGDLYTVTAQNLPADYYLKSVSVAGHVVERDQVQLGDQSAEIELVFSSQGGHINGLVLDESGQPISTPVVLIPDPSRRNLSDLFRKTTSDKNGIFNLRGIPPGTYQLMAFDDVDLDELIGQPEILNSFEDHAVTIDVEEQTDYSTALKIIRTMEEQAAAP